MPAVEPDIKKTKLKRQRWVRLCCACWCAARRFMLTFTCCMSRTLQFVELLMEERKRLCHALDILGLFITAISLSVSAYLRVLSVSSLYLQTWTPSAVAHVFGSCQTAAKLCRTWFLLFMKAAMAARWAAQRGELILAGPQAVRQCCADLMA